MNLEQFEAHQAATNVKKDAFYKTLDKEGKNKYDAIAKALEVLTEARVPTIMFCKAPLEQGDCPDEQYKISHVQYNNWADMVKLFEDFNKSEERMKLIKDFEMGFILCVYNMFLEIFNRTRGKKSKKVKWWVKIGNVFQDTFTEMNRRENK